MLRPDTVFEQPPLLVAREKVPGPGHRVCDLHIVEVPGRTHAAVVVANPDLAQGVHLLGSDLAEAQQGREARW